MKCVKSPDGEIKRLSEYEAKALVARGWAYVSKGEWKKAVRPKLPAMCEAAAKAVAGLKPVRRV